MGCELRGVWGVGGLQRTSEKRPVEHISRPEQRHGPKNDKTQRKRHAQHARNLRRAIELLPLLGLRNGRPQRRTLPTARLLSVQSRSGEVGVVALADCRHGNPVVFLRFEGRDVGQDWDEDDGGEEGDDVADEHGGVAAGRFDGEGSLGGVGRCQPGGHGAAEAEDGGEGCGGPGLGGEGRLGCGLRWVGLGWTTYLTGPAEGQGGGDDGGRDDDAHEEIQVAHADTDVVEHGGEATHEECKSGHGHVVDAHQLLAGSSRVDIGFVDVVGRDRRH